MADSMHLDSADLVGSLDEFETLEHIPGDFDSFTENHEVIDNTKVILSHSVDAIDMIQDVPPEQTISVVVKEESDVKMEDIKNDMVMDQEENISGDIDTVIDDSVDVEHILTVKSEVQDRLDSGQDLFTEDIIEEVVVGEEQIEEDDENNIKMEGTLETIDYFAEEEVISESLDEVANYVNKEGLMESVVSMEVSEPVIEEIVKSESREIVNPVSGKMVTPGVYVVATSNSNIVSAQSILPSNAVFTQKELKGSGGTRIVMSPVDSSAGHTIRIVDGQTGLVGGQGKAITLSQARQMGLFTQAKLKTLLPANIKPKPNQNQQGSVNQVKSPLTKKGAVAVVKTPAKILPMQNPSSPKGQKLLIRQTTALKPGTVITNPTGGQVIRIPAHQTLNNIAQIQLPGKQVQYVKLIGGPAPGKTVQATTLDPGAKAITLTSSIINSPQTMFKLVPISGSTGSTQRVLASQPVSQANTTVTPTSNLVVLPSHIIQAAPASVPQATVATTTTTTKETKVVIPNISKPNGRKSTTPVPIKKEPSPAVNVVHVVKEKEAIPVVTKAESWSGDENSIITYEANGIRPRKPCNCTKSMCLKLYCDCFANGEFCNQCNCTCCYNNLEHEEERQRAIKSCLERNPTAFRPKIGKSYIGSEERRHNRGCNCRRSGCLKNYCECYEAKIPCSRNCKCLGCRNVDSPFVLRREDDPRVMSSSSNTNSGTLLRLIKEGESASASKAFPYHTSIKQAYSMMTNEVVEATCQCLLAQAEDLDSSERKVTSSGGDSGSHDDISDDGQSNLDIAQSLILEEFSRCIVQIMFLVFYLFLICFKFF